MIGDAENDLRAIKQAINACAMEVAADWPAEAPWRLGVFQRAVVARLEARAARASGRAQRIYRSAVEIVRRLEIDDLRTADDLDTARDPARLVTGMLVNLVIAAWFSMLPDTSGAKAARRVRELCPTDRVGGCDAEKFAAMAERVAPTDHQLGRATLARTTANLARICRQYCCPHLDVRALEEVIGSLDEEVLALRECLDRLKASDHITWCVVVAESRVDARISDAELALSAALPGPERSRRLASGRLALRDCLSSEGN
jgi:hypothetical protein